MGRDFKRIGQDISMKWLSLFLLLRFTEIRPEQTICIILFFCFILVYDSVYLCIWKINNIYQPKSTHEKYFGNNVGLTLIQYSSNLFIHPNYSI